MAVLEINPNFNVQVKKIGQQQTPVIVIDNYCKNIAVLADKTRNAHFNSDEHSFYPGVRSPIAQPDIFSLIQPVIEGFYKVFKVPTSLSPVAHPSFFSLISLTEEELVPMQCIPHFDTSRPYYFAALLHINDGVHGSTGFFRHEKTGFERISETNTSNYLSLVQEEFNADMNTPSVSGYITESTEQFTLLETVEYRCNRLVIYPGNLLHSTIVDKDNDINDDAKTGRLTANLFVEFK